MRHRDSLLEAALLFGALEPVATLRQFVVFLYICENEGLNVQELSQVAGLPQTTASRVARSLGPPESEWADGARLGLVDAFLNPADSRSHVLRLTAEGRQLRDELDRLIGRATPIVLQSPA